MSIFSINTPARLIGTALLFSLTVSAGAALSLYEMRLDALKCAKDAGANIALIIERDVARNLELYSLSVETVLERLADPEVHQVSNHIRRLVLFDGIAQARDLGSILVTDARGQVVLDSKAEPARNIHIGDRDYFQQQARIDSTAVLISKPLEARTGYGASITVSRRLNDAQGKFAGVVSGALRISYFNRLFSGMTLGPKGAIALFYADGTLIARRPAPPAAGAAEKRSLEALKRVIDTTDGLYLGKSVRDGIERLYTYRRIGHYPLYVAVGAATEDIYANWTSRAWAIGLLVAVFNLVTMTLAYQFAKQLEKRLAAGRRHAELAITDALTGLPNRRALDAFLDKEWKRALRERWPVSVLMIDVDAFKPYNDHYGHLGGDTALKAVARCIQAHASRSGDLAARYGGEEFCIVLPHTDLEGAIAVAEHIRQAVLALHIPHAQGPAGILSVSIGVATDTPALSGDRAETLTQAADTQLYRAKTQGRNRTMPTGAEAENAPKTTPGHPAVLAEHGS